MKTKKEYGFWHIFWKTRTRTVGRVLMNIELSKYTLRGKVIDVGGGHRPDYFNYFQMASGSDLDILDGSTNGIDFEKDPPALCRRFRRYDHFL